MAFLLTIFLSVIIISLWSIWLKRKSIACSWKIPGPFALPLIGNSLDFIHPEDFFDILVEMKKKFGSRFRFWLGMDLFLYSNEPDFLRIILNAKECINKGDLYKFISFFLGDGLLTSKSPKWNEHRKILNPTFNPKILLSFYPIFNIETDKLVKKLDKMIDCEEFSLNEFIIPCEMDISCQTTMGTEMNMQNGENNETLRAYEMSKEVAGIRITNPLYQFDFIFQFTKWFELGKNAANIMQSFVTEMVENKRNKRITRKSQEYTDQDTHSAEHVLKSQNIFIDQALSVMENQGKLTIEDVKDNANIMVIAAFETTTVALNYIILSLAAEPEYQNKVIQEIRSLFPKKGCYISPEDTRNMVFTEMVINESIRLFPPVPLISRKLNDDCQIAPGFILPKGVNIILDIFSLHRSEKYWGSEVNKFNPYNFLPEKISDVHPYAFAPFSKGPRNCIGMKYAYISLKIHLAKIFQQFYFTTDVKLEDIKFRMNVSLTPITEPLVRIHRQKD